MSPSKTPCKDCIIFMEFLMFMFGLWRDSGISNIADIVKRLILDNDWWAMVIYPLNIYDQIFSMILCTKICSPYLYDVCDYVMQIDADNYSLWSHYLAISFYRHVPYSFSGNFLFKISLAHLI